MATRTNRHELSMRGIHGDQATSIALTRLGSSLDDNAYHHDIFRQRFAELSTNVIDLEKRIQALECKMTEQKNSDNENIKRALMDADNAIQKAIAHFRRTDWENVK